MFADMQLAADKVAEIQYKAGWVVTAKSYEDRFEGTILVRVDYPAPNANREFAPDYTEMVDANASFPVFIGDCESDDELYYRIFTEVFMEIEFHESREFFRVGKALEAPFHPHQARGMRAWSSMKRNAKEPTCVADLKFGVA